MVRDGLSQEQIEEGYHARFDADKVKNVDVGKAPFKGPEGAPVTLVEFADFECPYCALMSPVLEKMWEQHPQELRFHVYKFMPLSGHPHGEISARAGVAAMMQGKFWEMHDKLFANRDHLEQTDLDQYAKDIGLDLVRFHKGRRVARRHGPTGSPRTASKPTRSACRGRPPSTSTAASSARGKT